jgi:peptidoglycan/LPS O-acetylase OafA/YrhL
MAITWGKSEATSVKQKFENVQVLRAIAIGLVLLQHLSITPQVYHSLFVNLTMPFWSGVELFFVISGFVVTY